MIEFSSWIKDLITFTVFWSIIGSIVMFLYNRAIWPYRDKENNLFYKQPKLVRSNCFGWSVSFILFVFILVICLIKY